MALEQLLKEKNRLFWFLHISGWTAYGVLNALAGYIHGKEFSYFCPSTAYAVFGFLITLGLRYIFRAIWDRSILTVVLAATGATLLAAIIFSPLQTLAYLHLYDSKEESMITFWKYFSNAPFTAYIFLSWSGLYFGINYYLMLQEQTQKALKATALAHQSQLQMLRYQLNPHFLFNTLNAISTLVLDNNNENANKMLTRLSSFLRYSLVNEPTQKISLEQEINTLNLYLDIEKARFQERLKLNFNIEDRARNALIPNLLMQPLIENAIKYAIAPNENGGTISLTVSIVNGQLCIVLKDDGMGLAHNPDKLKSSSSGVGLVNTRERLKQLYGDKHRLLINNIEPHGLMLTIYIPYEVNDQYSNTENQ